MNTRNTNAKILSGSDSRKRVSCLPDDVVEMVREIRRRKYEATKHMTREEKWAYEQEGVDRIDLFCNLLLCVLTVFFTLASFYTNDYCSSRAFFS